jgi:transposase InsO family protein
MKELQPSYSLATLSGLFGLSRQGYYKHQKNVCNEAVADEIVLEMVSAQRKVLPRSGGRQLYHLLAPELEKCGIKMGRDALFDLLARNNLLIKKRKYRPKTTFSDHWMKKYPDLVKGYPAPARPGQLWVCDITYIKMNEGFAYLALITDSCSHKIVGYNVCKTLQAVMCLKALKMAISQSGPIKELIHHSDRGSQYCSGAYVKLLKKNHISISMTQSGNPRDNAVAERLNGILKLDIIVRENFKNFNEAKKAVQQAIITYNTIRPHSSCDMVTPEKAHQQDVALKKRWKTYYKPKGGKGFKRHETEHVEHKKTGSLIQTGSTLSDQDIPSLVAPQQSQSPFLQV